MTVEILHAEQLTLVGREKWHGVPKLSQTAAPWKALADQPPLTADEIRKFGPSLVSYQEYISLHDRGSAWADLLSLNVDRDLRTQVPRVPPEFTLKDWNDCKSRGGGGLTLRGEEEVASPGGGAAARGAVPAGEDVQTGNEDWLVVGGKAEAWWGKDWWQADVKRIRVADSDVANAHVQIGYVGGAHQPEPTP